MGPAKWSYFYLYVIIDILSRRVVAWCVVLQINRLGSHCLIIPAAVEPVSD
jgi:hypothetical protein